LNVSDTLSCACCAWASFEGVKFPERGVWDDLVRDLKLNDPQSNELKITIQHVVEDIAFYRSVKSKEPARNILTARLKLMQKALSNLQYQVNRSIHLMDHFLPQDGGAGGPFQPKTCSFGPHAWT
jgi:hypothetical protein